MSMLMEAALLLADDDIDAMIAVNRALMLEDRDRKQRFELLDATKAGGTKVFCSLIYAASFNFRRPQDVRAAVAGAPWQEPEKVFYWEDPYDFDGDPMMLSIAQLRIRVRMTT